MSITIIFATNNLHKIEEIKKIVPPDFHIITLKEAGINQDIPEPYNTLEENASAKSSVIHQLTQQNCFSEDTGLEVTALNGAPGVKSARYAGEDRNFEENIQKLLHNLQGKTDRSARFRTVVSLIWNKEEHYFEGICEGNIIGAPRGEQGFGYDPVFVPDGSNKTFAEMSLKEKNLFSHRRKATDKLIAFLKEKVVTEV
ncbi:RdgB/HAM1 family non-canonical purine NTP pyrophosphatase [Ilyomonas limi]|uniref:dITP/XTP pyrophosphatase n=1 Tax=Ilyomonas limi TaxID=2575867 RepID=A0A4U3L763_9BACT|nr:RdgB/HAM1 family non-canonical purine NTP pyrophosphatase [Ilyomonas limi]TKK70862.1 RdgB/HAM1 family non-canonical purine NTP pyrophosphatase [Ilyomonas limi]